MAGYGYFLHSEVDMRIRILCDNGKSVMKLVVERISNSVGNTGVGYFKIPRINFYTEFIIYNLIKYQIII